MRGNGAVRHALADTNVRIQWGIQAAHWRRHIAEHGVHAYAPVGALVAALVGALVPANAVASCLVQGMHTSTNFHDEPCPVLPITSSVPSAARARA